MPDGARTVPFAGWRNGAPVSGTRTVPEETAVAFVYDGTTYAVMMATPADLEDFAAGFCLTEGIVDSVGDIEDVAIVHQEIGIELRIRLSDRRARALADRRRRAAGPVGCGLCGIESLEEAMRSLPGVASKAAFEPSSVFAALGELERRQKLNAETRAVHGAAFWTAGGGIVAVREDIGRHNALDKLAGALARTDVVPSDGLLVLTSRLSVELVQKAAMIGAPVIIAVSAPTALAVQTAEAIGITLVGVARRDGFEVFTHPKRIVRSPDHVAS